MGHLQNLLHSFFSMLFAWIFSGIISKNIVPSAENDNAETLLSLRKKRILKEFEFFTKIFTGMFFELFSEVLFIGLLLTINYTIPIWIIVLLSIATLVNSFELILSFIFAARIFIVKKKINEQDATILHEIDLITGLKENFLKLKDLYNKVKDLIAKMPEGFVPDFNLPNDDSIITLEEMLKNLGRAVWEPKFKRHMFVYTIVDQTVEELLADLQAYFPKMQALVDETAAKAEEEKKIAEAKAIEAANAAKTVAKPAGGPMKRPVPKNKNIPSKDAPTASNAKAAFGVKKD